MLFSYLDIIKSTISLLCPLCIASSGLRPLSKISNIAASRSLYLYPSSSSSLCPSHKSALGALFIISSITPRCLARAKICVLYSEPIGFIPQAVSPKSVPYPKIISLLLLVPTTIALSLAYTSYKTAIRSLAARLPFLSFVDSSRG